MSTPFETRTIEQLPPLVAADRDTLVAAQQPSGPMSGASLDILFGGMIGEAILAAFSQPVLSIVTVLPGSPANGDRYLVAHSATTGALIGLEDQVVERSGGDWISSGPPIAGQILYVQDVKRIYRYSGTIWKQERGRVVYDDDPGFATLAAADAFAVTAGAALVIRNDFALAADLTLSAKLVQIVGAVCTLGTYNLTIANDFQCGGHQCFIVTGTGDPAVGGYALSGHPLFPKGARSIDPRWFGVIADNNPATDNGPAFSKACLTACYGAHQVIWPKGTAYINTAIQMCLYQAAAQSAGPSVVRGHGYSGSTIKASAGMTGVMIFARNMAGVVLKDFLLDGNGNAGLKWLDTDWWSAGPHQLNEYRRIICQNLALGTAANGGTPFVGHSARNNNQTIFANMTYRSGGDETGVALDIEASGGSVYLADMTVDAGVVRLTSQNAYVTGGSFHGWEFCVNQTGNNSTVMSGAQTYSNARTKACYSSGSPGAAGHTVGSLTLINCHDPVVASDHAIFDLVLRQQIKLLNYSIGAGFGAGGGARDINLFGPNMAGPPGDWNAKIIFEGGMAENPARLIVNRTIANIAVGKRDFENYGTRDYQGAADITKTIAGPFVSGTGKAALAAGVLAPGSYHATVTYNHATDGAPYIVQGSISFAVGLVNHSGSPTIVSGNFTAHLGGSEKIDLGITAASSATPGLTIIPNFSNTGTAQAVTVQISKVH